MKSVSFGSCNKQRYNQSFWQRIIDETSPELWLWIGDAFYTKTTKVDGLQQALTNLTNNEFYANFTDQTKIDGVWDDHDYGVNDAGKHVTDYEARRSLYMQFIGAEKTDYPGQGSRKGLYKSIDLDLSSSSGVSAKVKVILLDTRSFRDNHFIRSIGELYFPYSAMIAAGIRSLYGILGLGVNYAAHVLGEEQSQWLRHELASSSASFHVIVSSIQVLTSNPAVESWGHFPVAKRKLIETVAEYDPPGLVFLSGIVSDVSP